MSSPLSFDVGGSLEKGTGLFSIFDLFLGMPMAVRSAPLGLPLFLTLGGNFIVDSVSRVIIIMAHGNSVYASS